MFPTTVLKQIHVQPNIGSALNVLSSDMLPVAALKRKYKLPGDENALHVIPLSGGADSTALVILMHILFPETDFILLTTDTGAEEPEIYEALDAIEVYLGKKIIRLQNSDGGLYELIEKNGGFLPSSSARWCTPQLKLKPFEAWIQTLPDLAKGSEVFSYIGLRADEPLRVAFSSKYMTTSLPFVEMGVVRADVYRVLSKTIGIPGFYKTRTRSGCSACPLQRFSEQMGLLLRQPKEFARAQSYEKLAPSDEARYPDNSVELWRGSGLALRSGFLPLPERVDCRNDKRNLPAVNFPRGKRQKDDMFSVGVWVAAEFFVNPNVGDHGVWLQSLVSYSTTLTGIKKQLDNHYQHRLATSEVFGISPEEMESELRYAVYFLQLPSDQVDIQPIKDVKSYTWSQGKSYAQIRHIVGWIKTCLTRAAIKMTVPGYYRPDQKDLQIHSDLDGKAGELIAMDLYRPKKKISEDDAMDVRYIACPMCSI